jgi:TolB-like protein
MRTRWSCFALLVVLAASPGCAQRVLVQPVVDVTRYHRLAILPFQTESFDSTVGSQMADEVVIALLQNAPDIEVMERARVDAVLQEHSLSQSNLIDPRTALAVGKLLGVQALLTGSVTISIGNIQPTPLSAQRVVNGTATVRVIDVETGKIVWGDRRETSYADFLRTHADPWAGNVRTDHEMVERVLKDLGQAVAQALYPHYENR